MANFYRGNRVVTLYDRMFNELQNQLVDKYRFEQKLLAVDDRRSASAAPEPTVTPAPRVILPEDE